MIHLKFNDGDMCESMGLNHIQLAKIKAAIHRDLIERIYDGSNDDRVEIELATVVARNCDSMEMAMVLSIEAANDKLPKRILAYKRLGYSKKQLLDSIENMMFENFGT